MIVGVPNSVKSLSLVLDPWLMATQNGRARDQHSQSAPVGADLTPKMEALLTACCLYGGSLRIAAISMSAETVFSAHVISFQPQNNQEQALTGL
jgi:hypothetical protein